MLREQQRKVQSHVKYHHQYRNPVAELLGSPPARGLRSSQKAALNSCPAWLPLSLPCSQTRGRFSACLAPAQRKRSDRVPCLGAQTWVGVGGRRGTRDHSFLVCVPGILGLASPVSAAQGSCTIPALPQLPPHALCGCSGHPRSFPLCGSMLGAGSGSL